MTTNDRVDLRRAKRIAADFRPEERLERLLKLRHEDRPAWEALPTGTVIACGLYEHQRQVAADHATERTTDQ